MKLGKAKTFIDILLSECDILGKGESYFTKEVLKEIEEKLNASFEFQSGATKGVFIFKKLGFVIKFNFKYCEYLGTDVVVDYCDEEINFYHQVGLDKGYEEILPETFWYENMIIQEVVVPAGEVGKKIYNDCSAADFLKSWRFYDVEDINYDWLCDAANYYGTEYVDGFIEAAEDMVKGFCRDLHSFNLGYKLDTNAPCVLDFAGYYE